jgi:hypothetical protein
MSICIWTPATGTELRAVDTTSSRGLPRAGLEYSFATSLKQKTQGHSSQCFLILRIVRGKPLPQHMEVLRANQQSPLKRTSTN